MAKQEPENEPGKSKLDDLIPEIQNSHSLIAIAESMESMATQLRYAANQVKSGTIDVEATKTFRRSYGFVLNWLGNVFQAIATGPMHEKNRDPIDMTAVEKTVADIKSKVSSNNPGKQPKRKAE